MIYKLVQSVMTSVFFVFFAQFTEAILKMRVSRRNAAFLLSFLQLVVLDQNMSEAPHVETEEADLPKPTHFPLDCCLYAVFLILNVKKTQNCDRHFFLSH